VGNSRAFRRRLKAQQDDRPPEQERQTAQTGRFHKGHVPWNKGRQLTTSPSLSTVRRWLELNVADEWAERKTAEPDGKPGRPPVLDRKSVV
jgi:hypothetical protein